MGARVGVACGTGVGPRAPLQCRLRPDSGHCKALIGFGNRVQLAWATAFATFLQTCAVLMPKAPVVGVVLGG